MSDTIERWHRAAANKDAEALNDLLAEEATFHSPVVHTPQVGKAITRKYLAAAFEVLNGEQFRYVREIIGPNDAMLEFETEIDGIYIDGVDIIRWNDEGRITDFKVMLRPLKAVNAVHAKMAEMLQRG